MKILIEDGNEKKASENYTNMNMLTQYEVYKDILINLTNNEIKIITIHPGNNENFIPKGINLEDFDGIAWTGSVLNIYDDTPPIKRQIDLAKNLLKMKNKIFGSCWGLQVLATAAGGTVRKNPKGLEAIIARNISLNSHGSVHPMYLNKPKNFDAFCWHYDEIETLPDNCNILSFNDRSTIQSLSFLRNNSEVWAVQYHPEFYPEWMSGLMAQRKEVLLKEKIFKSEKEFQKLNLFLSNIKKFKDLEDELNISKTLIDKKIHTFELSNWLNNIKNSI